MVVIRGKREVLSQKFDERLQKTYDISRNYVITVFLSRFRFTLYVECCHKNSQFLFLKKNPSQVFERILNMPLISHIDSSDTK